jgi:two-component system, OmpR family, sensor histidine kinase BaeS
MDQNTHGMTDLAVPPVTEARPVHRASLRSRLDRLRVKLFVAIAGANALLAVAAYLVFSWTYDRGFVDYLNRTDQARLDSIVVTLAEGYGREQGWTWLVEDRSKWSAIVRGGLGLSTLTRPAGTESERPADPPREYPLTIDPRLFLFDADRKLLIGRAEVAGQAILKPIEWRGETVGHLGHIARPHYVESVNRVFSEQQNRKFGAIALGMLGAGLLLGAGLAHWLTKRMRAVARGTASLIQGDYDVRLKVAGHDELAQLAQNFNKLAATLAATRRTRQQWIADIAHELRTPLAVLRAEIEALQDGVRPVGSESLGSLAHEIGRLGRLVEDLQLLSLSDLGALSYHKEAVDVGELLEEVIAVQRRALDERPLHVDLRLERGAKVLADETRLAQVFGNLLQNTLRYTDAPGKLAIALRRDGTRVVIDWQDSSPGVADEDLPRLTDRLFRVDASRSRAGGGSGLGLAIVKAIIDAHDGTMIARRSPLGGLWWQIALPHAQARATHG